MDARKRLYPTDSEEQTFRELKERYGFRDAVVVRSQPKKGKPKPARSAKGKAR
jgi:hypothetical protein